MPWYIPSIPLSENIKKRVCAYLLQRYVGQFLEKKITFDQLTVDLYNGRGNVRNVSLDMQALNVLGEKQNWPVEFINGYIEEISLKVPWYSLLKDSTYIEIHGLKLVVRPKTRNECATSMFESMWSSMTNSMQLAQECMKQEAANVDNSQPFEGIEIFAQAIESILSRVKVSFKDTVIQLEHVPKDSLTGVGVVINIQSIKYSDEAGSEPPTGEAMDNEQNKAYIIFSFATKNFSIEGVTFSTVEFSSRDRTFSKSGMTQSHETDKENDDSIVTMLQESDISNEFDIEESSEGSVESETDINKDKLFRENVVMFGKIMGTQEIMVRLKQTEDITGPKVSIEVNIGALYFFLSPRQFYIILELINGLSATDIEDTNNVDPRKKCMEKPMTGLDYQRVEHELQQRLHPSNAFYPGGLQGTQGWSTAHLDESYTDDNFLPMRTMPGRMLDSTMSTASSSMESSLNSSMASSLSEATTNRTTRRKLNQIGSDPTAELSHFQIRLASIAILLLHEDLLTISGESNTLIASSVVQMKNTAENFFSNIGSLILAGYGKNDFDESRRQFEKACNLSHLRLLIAPVQIECDETTTITAFSLSGKLTCAKLEVLECLKQENGEAMEYVRLLHFNESPISTTSPSSLKPRFKMSFKHVQKTIKMGSSKRVFMPKTDILITLEPCTIEVDVTIVDRICALIHPTPICIIPKQNNIWRISTPPIVEIPTSATESQMDFKMVTPSLTLKLRFPIPDFRAPHDLQRIPWWKRNLRTDYLNIHLDGASVNTTFQTNLTCQKYIIECKIVNVHYVEKENVPSLHIAKAGSDERLSSLQDDLNCPRVIIQVHPVWSMNIEMHEDDSDPELMSQSMMGNAYKSTIKDPFSSKKLIHQSDTRHSETTEAVRKEEVIPGDKQEIADFIEAATNRARIQFDINLPTATIQLISKHIYEVLYNHLISDLILWQPSAPVPKPNLDYDNFKFGNLNNMPETYTLCKSGIQYDSDSESSEEFNAESSIFYSVYESKSKSHLRTNQIKVTRGQSYLTLNIHIGYGVVSMNSPVRDTASKVIPEQQGEFVLNVEEANIFTVTGYNGDENLGYVCVQSKGANLHHCDMITTPNCSPPLREITSLLPKHLHNTIYKSESGVSISAKDRGGDREMLSIVVQIQASHETHHVKTVRVALGINKATLRHKICSEPNSWITQLIDFFNVNDYNIPGFHAKDVLTELHMHLWDCAIDYRPFHLPLRSAVTLGTFSMSSHLSATSNTSTLRFIAEDCGLFLSEKAPPRKGVPSNCPVDLMRDYVSVVEVGLFELSLRTNDKASGINPHIDLRASNNIVNIRTCSDSGRALMQLITYFASDGDLTQKESPPTPSSTYSSPRHQVENELINVEPQDISNLSKSQHQQINDLLVDAMEETLNIKEENFETESIGAKIFFFPDEGQLNQYDIKPLPQVVTDLGDITFRSNKSSDTDEEFCMIGEEAGLGILPRNGLPQIRWLTADPFHCINNHFSIPLGKSDVLKPPKHYPTPELRYRLCNMTIVWQMYGGNDFKLNSEDKREKKTVNFSDTKLSENIFYSNSKSEEVIFPNLMENKANKKINWIIEGGINRDLNVLVELELNKIRFQHEVYPQTAVQSSRQVLLVTEIEVRDLLQSSEINKFLYLYTSQIRPKQSHANMLVIKALHLRPDLKLKTEECCLRVSVLPLRLNIDQDTLLFLIQFFNELVGTNTKTDESSSTHSTPTHQPPVMTVSTESNDEILQQVHKIVDENLLMLLDDVNNIKNTEIIPTTRKSSSDNSLPIYFRKFVFTSDVPIRLDYHGKRLDLTHGPIAGLLMGLTQMTSSELKLRRLSNNHGLLGFHKLLYYCFQEWLNDIKKNQLPGLLGGVGPMHSVVQFFQGIKDLFWMPIEQYQKDGRIVRGLQRGANSFTTSTAMAALELTSRIIHLIQITAETAYDMMSPGPSVKRAIKNKGRKRRYHQPQDIREGMTNAYNLVKEGIGETAENIVRVASHEHEQKGYSGAVGGVLRQIPPTFVKPIIIASEATNNVLGGMQSQLLPDSRREANQKWKKNNG